MAGFSGDDEDIVSDINMTPFVDITLVLLIIFMVTTSYIVKAQIEIDLPKAASGSDQLKETLTVQIDANGDFFLNGEPRSIEQIGQAAKAEKKRNPEIRAIIAADRKVEYDKVVEAIDAIKTNGIEKFALNIVRKEKM